MNITLYKAAEDLMALLDSVDPETGEIVDGIDAARDVVSKKAISVVAYLKDTESKIGYLESAARDIQDRIKKQKKRNEWIRGYLAFHMKQTGIKQISDDAGMFEAKLELERDEAVDVFDEAQLPDEYMREIPAKQEPNKASIKSALQDGFNVPGARLVKRDRLTIK